MGMMLALHNAFSDRSSALLTLQTLISELSSLHSRADKLESSSSKIFGGDKSRIRKLEDLKDAIRVTEDAKSCATKEYERIKVYTIRLFHEKSLAHCFKFIEFSYGSLISDFGLRHLFFGVVDLTLWSGLLCLNFIWWCVLNHAQPFWIFLYVRF